LNTAAIGRGAFSGLVVRKAFVGARGIPWCWLRCTSFLLKLTLVVALAHDVFVLYVHPLLAILFTGGLYVAGPLRGAIAQPAI